MPRALGLTFWIVSGTLLLGACAATDPKLLSAEERRVECDHLTEQLLKLTTLQGAIAEYDELTSMDRERELERNRNNLSRRIEKLECNSAN